MPHEIGIEAIADRYAEAMLDLAQEKECLDFVKNDLFTVANTIKNNDELKTFLGHPIISIKDKKEVIVTIFQGKISPYVINLMKLLLDRNRVFIINAIAESFRKLFNKRFNIVTAMVITAVELDESIKNVIQQKLSEILSKHVELSTKVDQSIIAGVIVELDDNVIDGSVKGRLEDIKQQLI